MKRSRMTAILLLGVTCGLFAGSDVRADQFAQTPLPESSPSTSYGGQTGMSAAFAYQSGACVPWQYGSPDLFYNFYAPNNCGGAPASLYLSPRPVPELVGHTYYTYQPFMPHELLYPHHRTYRHWYDGGRGMTRAHAVWYRSPVTTVAKNLHHAFRLPR